MERRSKGSRRGEGRSKHLDGNLEREGDSVNALLIPQEQSAVAVEKRV